MTTSSLSAVAEIQGYYGSLQIPEKAVQELWDRQEFQFESLTSSTGKPVRIIEKGNWNQLEGPDFKDAVIEIEGKTLKGDVEIHLYPRDWKLHGHDRDPNYDNVILHVTLFDAESTELARKMEHIALLPILREDLDYLLSLETAKDSLDESNGLPDWANELLKGYSPLTLHRLLFGLARRRWSLKCAYAKSRLSRYDWSQSCHMTLLEIMGYRRNRALMHELAVAHPIAQGLGPWDVDQIFESKRGRWKLRGVRPNNHPIKRIEQIRNVIAGNADWPETFRRFGLQDFWSSLDYVVAIDKIQDIRKQLRLGAFKKAISSEVFSSHIRGSRLDTLFCDGLLPLLTAVSDKDLFGVWCVWWMGDIPNTFSTVIKHSNLSEVNGSALCNGWAQGMIEFSLE
jgi:hypothetical protein